MNTEKDNCPVKVELLADSLNEATGDRLTTFRFRFWKLLQGELNTHRVLSRNGTSSRAVPAKKMRAYVLNDPYIPLGFYQNCKGMSGKEELSEFKKKLTTQTWLLFRYPALCAHWVLSSQYINLHKQTCNRLLEPWLYADHIVSATTWNNFIKLRSHSDAMPDIQPLANQVQRLLSEHKPKSLRPGQWHIPLANDDFINLNENDIERLLKQSSRCGENDWKMEALRQLSSARCARASYYYFDGVKPDLQADLVTASKLIENCHWSPLEHPAMAMSEKIKCGNYTGFKQYRKFFEGESGEVVL